MTRLDRQPAQTRHIQTQRDPVPPREAWSGNGPPEDQDLVRKRYQEKLPADQLAQEFGPSRRTLFRKLERIRRLLYDCISRRLASAGLS